jgi:hypothetical protein
VTALTFVTHACLAMLALVAGFVLGTYDRSAMAKLTREKLASARLDALEFRQRAERAELETAEAKARLQLLRMGVPTDG